MCGEATRCLEAPLALGPVAHYPRAPCGCGACPCPEYRPRPESHIQLSDLGLSRTAVSFEYEGFLAVLESRASFQPRLLTVSSRTRPTWVTSESDLRTSRLAPCSSAQCLSRAPLEDAQEMRSEPGGGEPQLRVLQTCAKTSTFLT